MCMIVRFLVLVFLSMGITSAEHWAVQDGNEVCIVMDANLTGSIKYNSTQSNETVEYKFNNATYVGSSGECHATRKNDSIQSIEIQFLPNDMKPPVKESQQYWSLRIWFTQGHEQTFRVHDFQLHVYFYSTMNSTVNETTYVSSDHAELEIGAEEKNAFKCSDSALGFVDATVNLKNLKVIAFANLNSTDFPKEQQFEQCSLDVRTSDIVPIIVGACLAGLVIAVLIAYLIGRARAKRQGYASV